MNTHEAPLFIRVFIKIMRHELPDYIGFPLWLIFASLMIYVF